MAKDSVPTVRNLYVSDDPSAVAPRLYVAGGITTVLRFEQPCDPARTKMMGWEGRFEPLLVGGKSVVLTPLQDIDSEDRLLLMVTLTNGTELPFIVTAREDRVDHQVNVFLDLETTDAMRAALADSRVRELTLREENQRYKEEETSVDHALAALLVKGEVRLTPFRDSRTWLLKCDGADIKVQSFTSADKLAVVFHIKNQHPSKAWKLMEARLSAVSTGETRPFALRMDQDEISPGASGTIAVIAGDDAFRPEKAAERLVLELFRSDGLMQAQVVLEQQIERE
jgi:uncharacterized protein (TIGR02268 family)